MATTLFIGGFPLETEEMELAQLIAPYGDFTTIKLVRDKLTRKSKGYAFIEMTDRQAAGQVIDALDGAEMQGRVLTVNIREDEPERPAPAYKKVERANGPVKKKRPRLNKP